MSSATERVQFVDLARTVAVLFMVQGHTLAVLLGPGYQAHPLFGHWLYLRGLTSCAFLVLSGFSFSLATDRYWADYQTDTPRLRRRLVRFAVFLLLGYAMRTPIRPLSRLVEVTPEQWQTFAIVDILHLVAVTLAALQVLTWLAGTRRRLGIGALVSAAAVILLTPVAWQIDWSRHVPVLVAAYLSGQTGSLFPVFPWAGYILLGAALGAWFVTRPADQRTASTSRAFLLAGGAMFGAGLLLHLVPLAPYGPIVFWQTSPNMFLLKTGSVLLVLALAAHLTRTGRTLPRFVTILSRESLTVYFVHVCILYGSIWNDGLRQAIGPRLTLLPTAAYAAGLIVSMALLAWLWHECKQRSGHVSVLVRATVAAAAVYAIT